MYSNCDATEGYIRLLMTRWHVEVEFSKEFLGERKRNSFWVSARTMFYSQQLYMEKIIEKNSERTPQNNIMQQGMNAF